MSWTRKRRRYTSRGEREQDVLDGICTRHRAPWPRSSSAVALSVVCHLLDGVGKLERWTVWTRRCGPHTHLADKAQKAQGTRTPDQIRADYQ